MRRKAFYLSFFILHLSFFLSVLPLSAQIQEPVKCRVSWADTGDGTAEIRFALTIDPGWHVYSTGIEDGPVAAEVTFETLEGAEAGKLTFTDGVEHDEYDAMFGMNVRFFERQVTFVQPLTLTAEDYRVEGYLQYGACNDQNCLPPASEEFSFGASPAGEASPSSPASSSSLSSPASQSSLFSQAGAVGGSLWGIFFAGCWAASLPSSRPAYGPSSP